MPSLRRRPAARPGLRRLRACDRGGATVEFVLWMPFFFGLLALITDVSVTAYRYGEMWDVARTAARDLAMGALPRDQTALQGFVQQRLSADYAATLTGEHTTFFVVEINAASSTLGVFGVFEAISGGLTARVGLGQEPMASI